MKIERITYQHMEGSRIGEDNICPITKLPCDDECCPPGAICNLSNDNISKPEP